MRPTSPVAAAAAASFITPSVAEAAGEQPHAAAVDMIRLDQSSSSSSGGGGAREQLLSLADDSQMPIFVCDDDDRYLYCNACVLRVFV